MNNRLLKALTCAAAVMVAVACGGGGNDSGAAVAVPTVESAPSAGAPLLASPVSLAGNGYVENEFIVRGQASRYRIASATADARSIDSGHAYTTRALVRRPTDAARFNGTVVIEWLNVSTGQDIDFVYGATRELLIRDGYAWVGVSVQRAGVERLVTWSPARYGNLSVAASNVDPNGGDIDPPNPQTAAVGGDVLGWDIYSQVAAAARSSASPLLSGLAVKKVIAAGESQSAFRLTSYYNSIQRLHRVYDGFLLYDRGGPGALRTDVGAKLMGFGSEFMNAYLGGSPQADSADLRYWEVAGASHVSLAEMVGHVDPVVSRDAALQLPNGTVLSLSDAVNLGNCTPSPIWSRVPNGDVMKAALKALNSWVSGGAAPVNVPRLVLDGQNQLLRDSEGRVYGGVRTAAYEVPTSTNVGVGGGACMLAGYHLDFTPAQLCQRYGSHAAYVARVQALTAANVRDGVLLPEEAQRTVDDAQAAPFSCAS
jgi:Alpha/beta hydrolase domain